MQELLAQPLEVGPESAHKDLCILELVHKEPHGPDLAKLETLALKYL